MTDYPQIVTRANLRDWVERPEFAAHLPKLIELLISKEVKSGTLSACEIKADEDADDPGFDGYTEADNCSSEFLPNGNTYWEIGKGEARPKANKEYKRLLEELSESEQKTSNFVFVSPRKFKDTRRSSDEPFNERTRRQWVSARDEFSYVKVIDEELLLKWLRKHPQAAVWLMSKFIPNIEISNSLLTRKLIENLISDFGDDRIDAEILGVGRNECIQELGSRIRPSGSTNVIATTEKEALAFAAFALNELGKDLERETLTIMSENLIPALENNEGIIFIVPHNLASRLGTLRNSNFVIVCGSTSSQNAGQSEVIRSPGVQRLRQYLEDKGFSTPDKLASMSGGFLTSALRLINSDERTHQPDYFSETFRAERENIILATMLGGWNVKKYYDGAKYQDRIDQVLISKFCEGGDFSNFIKEVNYFTEINSEKLARDTLATEQDNIYLIKAQVDAFDHIFNFMRDEHFDKFFEILKEVFSEEKPDPSSRGYFSEPYKYYSSEVRYGLALSFCIISCRGGLLGKSVRGDSVKSWASDKFLALLETTSFVEFLKQQDGLLGYFAEAVPEVFLQALKEEIQGNPIGMKDLLTDKATPYSISSSHMAVGLMWAIERLMWIETYFEDCMEVLYSYNLLENAGEKKSFPRPSSVITDTNRPWLPRTSVDHHRRNAILLHMAKRREGKFFDIFKSLLPTTQDSAFDNTHSKPIFTSVERAHTCRNTIRESYSEIVREILTWCKEVPKFYLEIIDSILLFDQHNFDKFKSEIVASAMTEEFEELRMPIWEKIRSLVSIHGRRKGEKASLYDDKVRILKTVLSDLEPDDVKSTLYLFKSQFITDFDYDEDYSTEKLEDLRKATITELFTSKGYDGLGEYANEVKDPWTFGVSVAKSFNPEKCRSLSSKILSAWDKLPEEFIFGFFRAWFFENKLSLIETLQDAFLKYDNVEKYYKIVLRVPLSDEIVDIVESQLSKKMRNRYWNETSIDFRFASAFKEVIYTNAFERHRHFEVMLANRYRLEEVSNQHLTEISSGFYSSFNTWLEKTENRSGGAIDTFIEVLSILKKRNLLTDTQLAQYEFPIATHLKRSYNKYDYGIFSIMTKDPEFFVDLVSKVYLGQGAEKEQIDENVSKNAMHVLMNISHPDLKSDKLVDQEIMLDWVNEIRSISREKGLEEISMQLVGETLASSKVEETDSVWPRKEVRFVIENVDSKNLLQGIQSKLFNELGVYSNGEIFFEGLAEKYEEYYNKITNEFPRTKGFLKQISKSYRADAKWHKKDELQRARHKQL